MKKILVFGSHGMLGMQFVYDHETQFEIIPLSRFHIDLQDTELIVPEILHYAPDAVVNCSGWTAVDKAENPRFHDIATSINTHAPHQMAIGCQELQIPFFHISTDFVFGGQTPDASFAEDDQTHPLNFYGTTKRDGEHAVLDQYSGAYVIRTAWLYGQYGSNFVGRIKHLGKKRPEVRVINDQFGSPTSTKYVAQTIANLIHHPDQYSPGIYHAVSQTDPTPPSWYDLAHKTFEILNIKTPLIPISTSEFPTPATRPTSSVLKNTRLPCLPKWENMLEEFLS